MTSLVDTELGPWERRRIRTSLEIECIALRLIAERGLDNVTVEQIANAAGISTRTFFRYFKNVRDTLTGVSARQTARLCELVMRRPPDEPLLDAFRAVYRTYADSSDGMFDDDDADADLKAEALELWGRIVRQDPELSRTLGHVNEVLSSGLENVIRARLRLPADDLVTAGALASALAGAVWFVYVRWLELGTEEPMLTYLEKAFDSLAALGQ